MGLRRIGVITMPMKETQDRLLRGRLMRRRISHAQSLEELRSLVAGLDLRYGTIKLIGGSDRCPPECVPEFLAEVGVLREVVKRLRKLARSSRFDRG